jgi:hypothetical protein
MKRRPKLKNKKDFLKGERYLGILLTKIRHKTNMVGNKIV